MYEDRHAPGWFFFVKVCDGVQGYVEQSLVLVLQLLERALALERALLAAAADARRAVLIVGLSKLILGERRRNALT